MLQQQLSMLRRWVWLLALAVLSCSAITYMIAKEKPIEYEASALLIVGPGIDGLNPNLNDLRAAAQLMQSYAELARTKPVLQNVVNSLNLDVSPERLAKSIETRADETTQILTINVKRNEAAEAAMIANMVAEVLVDMSPSAADSKESQLKSKLAAQIDSLEAEVARLEITVQQLTEQLDRAVQAVERSVITDRLAQERSNLAEARRMLSTLFDSFKGSYTNQVKIVEVASTGQALDSGLYLTVLMGGMAGLVVALAIVLGIEFLKDTIDTGEELAMAARIPYLGSLDRFRATGAPDKAGPIVISNPESKAAESYRMVGSKLLLSRYKLQRDELMSAKDEQSMRTMLISGAYASDNTSEIAANLAVVLAQTGYSVILVDAHLHNPTLHHEFGIPEQRGLADALIERSKVLIGTPIARATMPNLVPVKWAPKLSIVPGGIVPANPFELLVSSHMNDLIDELKQQADIVLITASPLISFAESLILASHVDGVVLVARSGKTQRSMVKEVVESLRSLNVHMIGSILDHNRASADSVSTVSKLAGSLPVKSGGSVDTQNAVTALRSQS
ncbi:MAG: hypothetical protein R3A44_40775 [Caldilineaceae bacterium]